MVERVDRRARAESAIGSDHGPCDKTALVHAEILAHHDIGADLSITIQVDRAKQRRFDDARAGIELDDAAADELSEDNI